MNAHSNVRTPRKRKPIPLALLIQLYETGMHEPDPFFSKGKSNERNR